MEDPDAKLKISYERLSNLAVAAFKNGIRLHFDAVTMFLLSSYPTATLLSILATEEFGKYFSVSRYVFYGRTTNPNTMYNIDEFLLSLYSHPRKQQLAYSVDGFSAPKGFIDFIESKKLEELKQRATYLGLKKQNGRVNFKTRTNNPTRVGYSLARTIVARLNEELVRMTREVLDGSIELDEESINALLNGDFLDKLLKIGNNIEEKRRTLIST